MPGTALNLTCMHIFHVPVGVTNINSISKSDQCKCFKGGPFLGGAYHQNLQLEGDRAMRDDMTT